MTPEQQAMTTDLTDAELAELDNMDKKILPDWGEQGITTDDYRDSTVEAFSTLLNRFVRIIDTYNCDFTFDPDERMNHGIFIAKIRNALPRLIREVRRRRAEEDWPMPTIQKEIDSEGCDGEEKLYSPGDEP